MILNNDYYVTLMQRSLITMLKTGSKVSLESVSNNFTPTSDVLPFVQYLQEVDGPLSGGVL